jgi:hypothetical protein
MATRASSSFLIRASVPSLSLWWIHSKERWAMIFLRNGQHPPEDAEMKRLQDGLSRPSMARTTISRWSSVQTGAGRRRLLPLGGCRASQGPEEIQKPLMKHSLRTAIVRSSRTLYSACCTTLALPTPISTLSGQRRRSSSPQPRGTRQSTNGIPLAGEFLRDLRTGVYRPSFRWCCRQLLS